MLDEMKKKNEPNGVYIVSWSYQQQRNRRNGDNEGKTQDDGMCFFWKKNGATKKSRIEIEGPDRREGEGKETKKLFLFVFVKSN